MIEEQTYISEVKIKRLWKTPDGMITHEKEVCVKNTDVNKAEKIARNIWKEDLK